MLALFQSRKAVSVWLFAVAAIILAMVVIGGLTRLTGSGLSITEWDPIMGAIPPMSDAAWAAAFAKYQQIPQYRLENAHMDLEGFKAIFWWEWTHRLLGRLIGVVFFVPFVVFAWTGAIRREEWPRMILLFALGGLQGFIGWWMVESGLETRVSVSQYRLAIHLGTAIMLLGAILWTALEYLRGPATGAKGTPAGAARWSLVLVALVYVQMLLGALVAGLHGGLVYNTWPSMDGRFFPELSFTWASFFEDPGLAQFDHRIGAYLVLVVGLWTAWRVRMLAASQAVAALILMQVALGIATLLAQAPVGMAAAHQLVAALLFSASVWLAYEIARRSA
ncbi:MAG: COX15/CtaA family protein [Alphaproteobacteria bacterium]|nr:COX15/CtaA family protein [Alphaproteobacteria bacterium]